MELKRLLPVLAAAAVAAGCAKSSKAGQNLTVSAAGASTAGATTARSVTLPSGIGVDRVRFVVREIDLEPVESSAGTGRSGSLRVASHGGGDDGEDHPEGEVKIGPFLVDLAGAQLTGPVIQVLDARVPPGTYHEIRVKVHPIPPSEAGPDTGSALYAMALAGASFAVDGTPGTAFPAATAFSLSLPVHAGVKQEGAITVAADGSTANVTVKIDPTHWFDAPGGGTLDPADPRNAAQITANIAASIRTFCDADEDGEDDHGGHGGPGPRDGPPHT